MMTITLMRRCKLYYIKDKEFKEKGLGILHIKKVDEKAQLLVRADTNLGNILLNIHVNEQISFTQTKNNVRFVCVPNPAIPGLDGGPVTMLVRVKNPDMAEELLQKLKEVQGK